MERFRHILRRLLYPGLAVAAGSIPLAAALLLFVFTRAGENTPIAYCSYALSAYSLTIVCAWLAQNAGSARQKLRTAVHGSRLAHRWLTDLPFKTQVSLYVSLGLNLTYAVLELIFGVRYGSAWSGTLAVYYGLLAVMRWVLLRCVNRAGLGVDLTAEWKRCRLCGVILLLMNLALLGEVVLMLRRDEGFEYAGYLIYVMALYAFYNVIAAVVSLIKYRGFGSPVLSAATAIRLAAALVSLLALETAMLAQFGTDKDPEMFRRFMVGATGGCVCLIVLAMAVCMVVNAALHLRKDGLHG